MRAKLKLVKPSPTLNGTVPPKRAYNAEVRPREYLTPKEVERLTKTARARGRYGARDGLAILVIYRHGLRAAPAQAWHGQRASALCRGAAGAAGNPA
jgi:integrase